MEDLEPGWFVGFKNEAEKAEQVKERLWHYYDMKHMEPQKLVGFTHEVFYNNVKEHVKVNGDFGLENSVNHFSNVMQEKYGFKKENADRFAIISQALIAGMELKERDHETITLMREFDVGAEEYVINYEEKKRPKTNLLDELIGSGIDIIAKPVRTGLTTRNRMRVVFD